MGFFHRNHYLLTWRIWGIVKTPSILLTFGVEMRAYGQKLVQFCKHTHTHKHTHTRVSYSSIDIYIYIYPYTPSVLTLQEDEETARM